MIEIDGSHGEGGGQILRNAIALASLFKKPIKIINIRANRPNPGIKPQHYISIKIIKELCNAETEGLNIDSTSLIFKPGNFKGGNYKFDIGTAGSITLVFQACILACFQSKEKISINLKGGSDVKWAPSWDYYNYVFLKLIEKMNIKIKSHLLKRGYYPKGGGEAELNIEPIKDIKPFNANENQEFKSVEGIIHISNLPYHITKRMKHSSLKIFVKNNIDASIECEEISNSLSPGTGITLWSQSNDSIIGTTIIGEKGITAEEIGKAAANNLLKEIESGTTIDEYAFDQILPYFALAAKKDSSTCIVRKVSNHALTNMWLIKKFLDVNFQSKQVENIVFFKVSS